MTGVAKKLLHTLSGMFWALLWLFSLGTLSIIGVFRWWPGDQLLVVRLFNYAMPWLLAVCLPALVAAGLSGRRWLFFTLALSTGFIVVAHAHLFFRKAPAESCEATRVRVMSYNVWSRNQDLSRVARVVARFDPDILLVQELAPTSFERLTRELSSLLPEVRWSASYDAGSFLATYSRYPQVSPPNKGLRSVQKSLVHTPKGPLTVYNVHFLRTVLRHRANWQRLHDQVAQLMTDEINLAPGPLIVGGDFNITDQTETFRLIARRLRNAHSEAGEGFGFTFPSKERRLKGVLTLPPLVRIDHLFCNDRLHVCRAGTLADAGGSDHFPVTAEFSWPALPQSPAE
jgi:vancomycin resistance protein VanJ